MLSKSEEANLMNLSVAKGFISNHRFLFALLIILFLFSLLVPINGDDFTFLAFNNSIHDSKGLYDAMLYMFTNLNGRVIGNGLELLLIDAPILSAFTRACITTLIVYVALKMVKPKARYVRDATALGVLLVPFAILAQTYAWQAGFFNYVTSTAGVLTLVHLIQLRLRSSVRSSSVISTFLTVIVGFLTALFTENVTIISLGLLIPTVIGFFIAKNISAVKALLPALVGVGFGAILMFSSPVYNSVASGDDGYRSIAGAATGHSAESGFAEPYIQNAYAIVNGLLGLQNILLLLGISVVLALFAVHVKSTNKNFAIKSLVLAVAILYPITLYMQPSAGNLSNLPHLAEQVFKLGIVMFAVIYIISLTISIRGLVADKEARAMATACVLLSVAFVSPFVVVNPFGPRNFLLSYVLLIIAVFIVIAQHYRSRNKTLELALRQIVIVCIAGMFVILSANKVYEIRNISSLRAARDNPNGSVLTLQKYPFYRLIHDPHSSYKTERYAQKCNCKYTVCNPCKNNLRVRYE